VGQSNRSIRTLSRVVPNRKLRLVSLVILALLFLGAYGITVFSYQQGLDPVFVEPKVPPNAVTVVLAPVHVEADRQTITTNLLLFPGQNLLDDDGRLTQKLTISITPSVEGGEATFRAGRRPTPKSIILPAPGVIENYPFDTYQVFTEIEISRVVAGDGAPDLVPIASQALLYVNAPGWAGSQLTSTPLPMTTHSMAFEIRRSAPTVIIALILVAMMASTGILGLLVVVAVMRGRFTLALANAAWLTAALFALITLRSRMPGSPPLGSWIDILVYFWVIVGIMLSVIVTITMLLVQESRETRVRLSANKPAREEMDQ
jgi:hypothetical protein